MPKIETGFLGLAVLMIGCSAAQPAERSNASGGAPISIGGSAGSRDSSGGSVGEKAAGGASGANAVGAGGSGSGAAGSGAAGSGAGTGCGTTTATTRTTRKNVVSDKVVDYVLDGTPGASDHHVLLLLFNASSKSAATADTADKHLYYTPEQLGDVYFNDPNGVQAFMNEASYGKVSLSGRVVGWFNQTGPMPKALDFQSNVLTYVEQAASYATFSDYDVIYIVGLTDGTDSMQLGWGLQNSLMTSQGHWDGGIDWMINSDFFRQAGGDYYFSVILPSRSWAHEFTHTLGIAGHDVSLDCGMTTLATSCAINAYGNDFSLMGESALGNHSSIGMKDALGWLGAGQMPALSATGQVTVCPTETVDDKPKGLVIPLKTPITLTSTTVNAPATYNRIYVEYRSDVGFDRYLDRLNDSSWLQPFLTKPATLRKDGVLITLGYADATTQASALLDMHPTSDFNPNFGLELPGNTGKFLDAMLYVGESFELADQGIKISPIALADGGITVKVDY